MAGEPFGEEPLDRSMKRALRLGMRPLSGLRGIGGLPNKGGVLTDNVGMYKHLDQERELQCSLPTLLK